MKLKVNIALCLALLLSACTPAPQNLIVGRWEAESAAKVTAQFRPDGTASLTMLGQTLQGTYKVEGDELVWTVNGITTRAKMAVTATELELTDKENRTIKYKRK